MSEEEAFYSAMRGCDYGEARVILGRNQNTGDPGNDGSFDQATHVDVRT